MSDAYKEINGVYPAPKTLKGSIAGSGKLVGNIFVTDLIHGKSAYQIAIKNGFKGTEQEWLDSLADKANAKAMTYADEAKESARRANLAASEATEKEQSAIKAKDDAEKARDDASVFARDAEGYSVVAAMSANDAKSSAETASAAAVQATARAEEARNSAENALNSANNAYGSENRAKEFANTASEASDDAERYKKQAESARDEALNVETRVQSMSEHVDEAVEHVDEAVAGLDNAVGFVGSKTEEIKNTAEEVKSNADRAEEAVTTGKDAAIADIEEAVKDGKDAAIMALDAREQAIIDSLPDTYTELYEETKKKPDIESNIIVYHNRITFQGTGKYLYKDFFVDDPEIGAPYSIFVGSIENSPLNQTEITLLDASGNTIKKVTKSEAVNSHLYLVAIEGTARIKFTCYATQSGGLSETPSYYNDVYVFKGYEITRDLPSIAVSNVHSATIARMIPSSTVKTIAHRGLCNRFVTQDSHSAYIECRRMGFVCAENDLQTTSDGVYIMHHEVDLSRQGNAVEDITGKVLYRDSIGTWYWYDSYTKKLYTYENGGYIESGVTLSTLTKATGASIVISQTSYANLKRVNVGKVDNNTEQIETFEEWLYLMKCLGMDAYVDCKESYTSDQWSYLIGVARKLGMLRHVTWIVLWEDKDKLRAADPHARFGLTWTLTDSQMEALRAYTASGEVIYYGTSDELTEAIANKARDCGLVLECWYVPSKYTDDEERTEAIKRAVSLGVEAIATDYIRVEDLYSNVGTSTSGEPVILQGGGNGGGSAGEDGATFIPYVSPEGVISWTNDGGRDNPDPVNIKGDQGKRGTGVLNVTTEPTAYTTETAGVVPIKRMAISTIKAQSGVGEVLVGDLISHSFYHYHIYYLDATYAYMDTYKSIRGATGAAGSDGKDGKTPYIQDGYWYIDGVNTNVKAEGKDYVLTEADKTAIANITKGLFNTEPWTVELEDGSTVTKKVVLA